MCTVPLIAIPHDQGGWTTTIEVHAGAGFGMSGGIVCVPDGLSHRPAGLIRKGGDDAFKSLATGPGQVARFLADAGMNLPGCPGFVARRDSDQEIRRRFREAVLLRTADIDIRGFQQSDGKAKKFAIEDIYIQLTGHGTRDR